MLISFLGIPELWFHNNSVVYTDCSLQNDKKYPEFNFKGNTINPANTLLYYMLIKNGKIVLFCLLPVCSGLT